MAFWLIKSEPVTYGIHHLKEEGETLWDGVRNYQARNFLQAMAVGDQAFFYHSNCKPPGIVGLMTVTAVQVVDPSQFDPGSPYFDPKATITKPRWFTVKAQFTEEFSQMITLPTLKAHFQPDELAVLKKGNRLSVLPVSTAIAKRILDLA
ncbi:MULTISPECIES: EVE domain-containing protein [unclassified Synechocystis]|uniref:EVE domain-containing protein n=1 Tax=unclassified Synechocystis TaxID=2640012 RepID=UPI00040AE964|nr:MULTISPECIES: EVE domain-containing protein [unclassified Synechocystis]MCT0254700.1 EVE domain-containing protein [Synechocystis sp. CS-94]